MLRPDSPTRRDMLTDHAMTLIAQGGVAAVTFKTLANRIGYSPQAIHLWVGTRDRLMEIVAATFYQRWVQWTTTRLYEHAALALLPADERELGWTRVLLALEEQARVQPDLGPTFSELHRHERYLVGRAHPDLATDLAVDRLEHFLALVSGLRAAVCRSADPMPLATGRQLLASHCTASAGPRAAGIAGYLADGPLWPT